MLVPTATVPPPAAAAATVFSLLLGWFAGVVLLLSVAGGWAYNLGLKAAAFSGAAYLFAFGALTVGVYVAAPSEPWWVPVVSALLGFGAHFANVLRDLRADAATSVRGLPHRLGPRTGVIAMAAALATASVVSGLAPAGAAVLYSASVVTTGVVLAAATTTAAVRAPHSAIAFRLTVVIALLDVVLLVSA
ncbi:UbiA family prenyltransferase [Lentzea sp. JNUCC 0626]|uniref:UbiA family prenyltransferase n=1 Tax=Lentzea sp. JNUCC 0626 TaxID=3367513 RepID=UPI003748963F